MVILERLNKNFATFFLINYSKINDFPDKPVKCSSPVHRHTGLKRGQRQFSLFMSSTYFAKSKNITKDYLKKLLVMKCCLLDKTSSLVRCQTSSCCFLLLQFVFNTNIFDALSKRNRFNRRLWHLLDNHLVLLMRTLHFPVQLLPLFQLLNHPNHIQPFIQNGANHRFVGKPAIH